MTPRNSIGNSQQIEPFSVQNCLQNRAQQQQFVHLKAGPLQKHGLEQSGTFSFRAFPRVLVSPCHAIQRSDCVFDKVCAETSIPQRSWDFIPSLAAGQTRPCAHTSVFAANFTWMNAIIFRKEMSVRSLGNGGNAALAPKVSLINVKGI